MGEPTEVDRPVGSRRGERATFNVLWPGGELATRQVCDMVMEAAGILRRLGVDVRIRATAVPTYGAGPEDASGEHAPQAAYWADTVLVVDDASRAVAAMLADLDAALAAGPDVLLLALEAPTVSTQQLQEHVARAHHVRMLAASDAALLAAAWLPLTESAARREPAMPPAGTQRPRPACDPEPTTPTAQPGTAAGR
ncbi:hypothetical protein [Actinomyces sp. MRS3W]|uniref:hypothetical protein n=1 Tax=Actinomyces sp. MRS3W TaxID=2800796 RepID=UPI0028FD6FEE|nr:hypothetical protein [Actinomyces sp. MRS3W]MDU0348863.1 hypothetical protein [Actinomyces sp. MRS3W]